MQSFAIDVLILIVGLTGFGLAVGHWQFHDGLITLCGIGLMILAVMIYFYEYHRGWS